MRRSSFRSVVVSTLLAVCLSSVSATAAARDAGRDRDLPFFERIMKKIVATLRSTTLSDTMSVPKP